MNALIYWAIPFFILTMLAEWGLLRHRGDLAGYALRDSAASISMGLGNVLIAAAFRVVAFGLFLLLWEHRLFELDSSAWWFFPALILLEDHCYYWFHRASHEVRLFWAAHVNHHSSTHYNLSTALRQSWTSPLVGVIFWAPLALIGFHPTFILLAQAISLLYQYWLHTELIRTMGPLEWALNTPSHHRVHHGRNPEYLDRNYAGILIVWDRLYGSFEQERAPVDYGLTVNLESYNPVVIAFHEWRAMLGDVARARTWRGRLGYLLGPPGWREDGAGKTSRTLRRDALAAAG
ncbi:MAG: sterol desaturase family protein [Deltaproteobacteria bacterium]|nr:sterol desaturase family protein [Deltaproteobacteria bacterium]